MTEMSTSCEMQLTYCNSNNAGNRKEGKEKAQGGSQEGKMIRGK